MQRRFVIQALIALMSVLAAPPSQARPADHVVLISIDGLRPEFYLSNEYSVPQLRRLMREGVHAKGMKSVFPSYTYPSHVAMLTGALPARSGIHHNVLLGSKGEWNWFLAGIEAPTLWQALQRQGMQSAAVQWPVSVGEGITWNVPEIWDPAHPHDRISVARKHATPGLLEEIERNATGKLDADNMSEEYDGLDINAARMAAYIFNTRKPGLLAVHFAGVDGKQHQYGREHEAVRLALANVDHSIGVILEAIERSGLKDRTTVIVVGDHGFIDIRMLLRPNQWLEGVDAKFQSAGGSAFLYLDKPGDAAALAAVKSRLAALPPEQTRLFRIIEPPELERMGADSAAALALAAVPGIAFTGSEGEQMAPTAGGHHGYDPDFPEMRTGFIAAGAGIRKGADIQSLCVADIAPLVARLLGLDFKGPDGVLHPGLFD